MSKRIKGKFIIDAAAIAAVSGDIAKLAKRALETNGFLKTPARISRTGLQDYTKLELGIDASLDTVRLYRPPEEVFSADTLASFEGATVTFLHPDGGVDSGNWRQVACGDGHNVEQDADDNTYTRADLIVRDQYAIEGVAYGVKEISCGYDFEIDMTPGVTPSGERYDGVQRNIRGNHIALVPAGRCGSGCAIGDCACQGGNPANRQHRKDTAMRKLTLNGITIDLEDTAAQVVDAFKADIESKLTAQTKRATDAETALAAQGEAMKTAATAHQTALDAANAKILKPEAVNAMVTDLVAVRDDAKRFSPDFETKGKTAAEIRIGVLTEAVGADGEIKTLATKILGSAEPAKASDVLVRAAFDAVVALGAPAADDDGDAYQREVAATLAGKDGERPVRRNGTDGSPKVSGRQLMIARGRGQAPAQQ